MKKDSLCYEIGVLMALVYSFKNGEMEDSLATIINSFDDDEIMDEFLISGMKNQLLDTFTKGFEEHTDEIIREILEKYELNIELYPMTVEDDEKLDKFFEKEELFLKELSEYDNALSYTDNFLFEDFNLAKEIANENKNIYIYTLVDGDNGTAWIIDGWHYVNRQGYFFTTEKIDIPREGIRCW